VATETGNKKHLPLKNKNKGFAFILSSLILRHRVKENTIINICHGRTLCKECPCRSISMSTVMLTSQSLYPHPFQN
jgi:hypothetical protein